MRMGKVYVDVCQYVDLDDKNMVKEAEMAVIEEMGMAIEAQGDTIMSLIKTAETPEITEEEILRPYNIPILSLIK